MTEVNKMNVTSLLNTGAAAAGRLATDQSGAFADDSMDDMYHQDQMQHQRMGVARMTSDPMQLPVRERTPWDGNGWLPNVPQNLKENQLRSFNTTDGSDNSNSLPITSPKSHHKFSDSHASLSSAYTSGSSGNSSHSRLSSLSTVSEYQPLGAYNSSDCTVNEQNKFQTEHGGMVSCPSVFEVPPSPRDGSGTSDNDEVTGSDGGVRSPSDAIVMRNRLGGSARYAMNSPLLIALNVSVL